MIEGEIVRFADSPFGTFGQLLVESAELFTVERPWLDNEPFKSCIPTGEYDLIWLPTTTQVPPVFDGHTWYFEGPTVGLEKHHGKRRYEVAMHVANIVENVVGCVGPGKSLGWYSKNTDEGLIERWSVRNSMSALEKLYTIIGPNNWHIKIRNGAYGG